MLYGIALPPYDLVKKYDGRGNYAIKKYYRFPFNLFYLKKFKMIVEMMTPGKIYRNILDFGAGPAEIFKKELGKHAIDVRCFDYLLLIDPRAKFDLIICASVLEFVDFPSVLIGKLKTNLSPKGQILIASPMESWLSKLYFRLIGDDKRRHSHAYLLKEIKQHFTVIEYKEWAGLYFACKATAK